METYTGGGQYLENDVLRTVGDVGGNQLEVLDARLADAVAEVEAPVAEGACFIEENLYNFK